MAAVTVLVVAFGLSMLSGLAFRCALYGLGIFPVWLHVKFFDHCYLKKGKID
jgi:hypothetical protein